MYDSPTPLRGLSSASFVLVELTHLSLQSSESRRAAGRLQTPALLRSVSTGYGSSFGFGFGSRCIFDTYLLIHYIHTIYI